MAFTSTGRFCQSCAKQVVDFSAMTDQEILSYISKTGGSTCGRFANDQLQRRLVPVKQEKKKFWWIAAIVPLLMSFEKGTAQKKNTTRQKSSKTAILPGQRLLPVVSNNIQITGKITDAQNQPLPYATVIALNGTALAVADSAGDFVLKLHTLNDIITITASAIGYEPVSSNINTAGKQPVTLVLAASESDIAHAPKIAPLFKQEAYSSINIRLGGYSSVSHWQPPTKTDTFFKKIDTLTRRVFHTEKFKASPNPAQRGGSVNIEIKKPASFSIQLFDNSGKLVQVKQFEAAEGAAQTSIAIPSSLAAGMYYIRLVDEKKKKQYTDKIVVE